MPNRNKADKPTDAAPATTKPAPATTKPDPVQAMMDANFRPPTPDNPPTAATAAPTTNAETPPNAVARGGTPPRPEQVGPILLKLAQVMADTSRNRDKLHELCMFLHANGASSERLEDASDPMKPPTLIQQIAFQRDWWALKWPF